MSWLALLAVGIMAGFVGGQPRTRARAGRLLSILWDDGDQPPTLWENVMWGYAMLRKVALLSLVSLIVFGWPR